MIQNLSVKNNGWQFKAIDINDANIEEKYRIRGYVVNKMQQRIIQFDNGKTNVCSK